MKCRQIEIRILVLLTLMVWIKFFIVDYMVADVLNWPSFGSLGAHPVRHTLRALAVAVPSLAAILSVIIPVSLVSAKYRGRALLTIDILFSVLVLTDVLFIRYYSDIFIFRDILLLPQTGLIAKSIWSLLKVVHTWRRPSGISTGVSRGSARGRTTCERSVSGSTVMK